jgi:hypothetical protein
LITTKSKSKKAIAESNKEFYINSENIKINIHTPYKTIIQEIQKLGIETKDISIDELYIKLDALLKAQFECTICEKDYEEQVRCYMEYHNKLRVLYLQVNEVLFNLYEYNENAMPERTKRIFINQIR